MNIKTQKITQKIKKDKEQTRIKFALYAGFTLVNKKRIKLKVIKNEIQESTNTKENPKR